MNTKCCQICCDSIWHNEKKCALKRQNSICLETQKCIEHCTESTHGHCVVQYCGEIQNICEETSACKKHCINHLHCYFCNSFENICRKTRACKKHCILSDSNHCIKFECDSTQNICKEHN